MATRESIAIRRNEALEAIAVLLGEGLTLPTQGKDPDLLYVEQLEAIRDFLANKETALRYSAGIDWAGEPPVTALQEFRKMEPVQVQAPAKPVRTAARKAKRR